MDLNTVSEIVSAKERGDLSKWKAGTAWLAGGSWLFSEPQTNVDRLIDLASFAWEPLVKTDEGLKISATCTLAQLHAWSSPVEWLAAGLIDQCCRSLLGSFKVWNVATVGGNICLSLPAGPMISLATALDGVCTIWSPDGSERCVPITDFVIGSQRNVLQPGEILRCIDLPAAAFRRRAAFRQISLTPVGRSGALLIGTLAPDGACALTITGSTIRPIRLTFPHLPERAELAAEIERNVPSSLYHDDIHGRPDWRRHVTFHFAEAIRTELAGEHVQ